MSYKIKIKHNLPKLDGKTQYITVSLCYVDPNSPNYNADKSDVENSIFPVINLVLTDEYDYHFLDSWDPGENGSIDVDKIKIVNPKLVPSVDDSDSEPQDADDNVVIKIEQIAINIASPTQRASQEVIDDELNKDESYDSNNTIQYEILGALNNQYPDPSDTRRPPIRYISNTYNENLGKLIHHDESKHLYDVVTSINRKYANKPDMRIYIFGTNILHGAFVAFKESNAHIDRRTSYTSIYYSNTLIEANSQYARFVTYQDDSIGSQAINEEGNKNGVRCYGHLTRDYRLCDCQSKIPSKTDSIVNTVYDGEDSAVLYISFAPAYSEASTGYKAIIGDIYINDVKIARGTFVRVRLKIGQEYTVHASAFSSNGDRSTNSKLKTLGKHKVTLPLYSDNILKIVVYDETESHFNDDLSVQARANLWGLPRDMFVGPLPNWTWTAPNPTPDYYTLPELPPAYDNILQ